MRSNRYRHASCLAFVFASSSLAAAQRPLAPADVVSLWRVSDPQISPDGSRVAFVLTEPDAAGKPRASLWLAQAGVAPRELKTPGPAAAPRWFPDGRSLAFVSPAPGSSQIGRLAVDDGAVEILATLGGAVRDVRPAPDGATLAFLETDAETPAEAERKKRGDDAVVVGEDLKHTRLHGLDLRTRALRRLVAADETIWRFSWSPDGKRIAYLGSAEPTAEGQEYRSALSVVNVADGGTRRVAADTHPHAAPAFSPDARSLAYLGPVGRFKERGVVQVAPADGGGPAVPRLADLPLSAWDVTFLPSGALLAGIQRGTRHALALVNGDTPPRELAELHFSLTPYWDPSFTVSADGRRAAFVSEAPDHLEEVFVADLDGSGRRQRLTRFSDRWSDVALGSVESVRWTNPADGSGVEGVVVRPPTAAARPLPTVTLLHGGPAYGWGLGAQARNWAQLLAAQGYLVFLPNFRGSAGYGMAFMTANVRDWGPGPLSDVLSGVDELVRKGEADPRRLFVGGGSYGGYLTAWAVTHTDRFKAAYVWAGVSSLASEYALTDEPSFLVGYLGATPYDDPEVYARLSPAAHAAAARTPTLIAHGERDLRVPVSQAYELHAALRHHGAPSRLVVYPREGHGLREPAHQLDFIRRVLEWFRAHDAAGAR